MKKFSLRPGRNRINHPDLPLSPHQQAPPTPPADDSSLYRRATTGERFSNGYAGDRRSIAAEPGYDPLLDYPSHNVESEVEQSSDGLKRAQTVLRKDARRVYRSGNNVSPSWAPNSARLDSPSEQSEAEQGAYHIDGDAYMSSNQPGLARRPSTDSAKSSGVNISWNRRQLQRFASEHAFREQRQGGQSTYPPSSSLTDQTLYNNGNAGLPFGVQEHAAQQVQQSAYQGVSTAPHTNAAPSGNPQPATTTSPSSPRQNVPSRQDHSPSYVLSNQQYSPPDPAAPIALSENLRPALTTARSYSQYQQQGAAEDLSMSSTNNGSLAAPKSSRSGNANRQSMHNGLSARDAANLSSQQTGGQQMTSAPTFNASVVPPPSQPAAYQGSNNTQQPSTDMGRTKTPQPIQTSEDMTNEEINQLIKDHKELREKYTKVKKYYFEKEDQVKQLQNSLAHQRLSQSRTSLDDSEYTTRFNRLDGLIAQLAFAIRKGWRTVPPWLTSSVNKDAISIGKQEMTAAGRAFISYWIVEEVFEKYFHPDLDPTLSAHLKRVQRNIRRFAPFSQTAEEEEYLTSKVVNWRLSTLEGLQEELRSVQCATNRAQLTEMLKRNLINSLSAHLHDPAPPDLEGGVHMIVELVVSIASHLPLESRDVVIEYFTPGYTILHDQMKLESGIPNLTVSIAEEAGDHEIDDGDSDDGDSIDTGLVKKAAGGMLSALTGGGKSKGSNSSEQRKNAGSSPSSSSLNRPESAQGVRELVPRVRMAAGIGVQIRGRSVLVKAPVFATT